MTGHLNRFVCAIIFGLCIFPFVLNVLAQQGGDSFEELLAKVNSDSIETSLVISPDMKEAYFVRKAGVWGTPDSNKSHIYVTYRRGDGWTNPQLFEHSGKFSDTDVYLNRDGKALWFSSNRTRAGNGATTDYDIWFCLRNGKNWSSPQRPENVNAESGNDRSPVLDRRGNLYFSSSRANGFGLGDIYVCKRKGPKFDMPANVGTPVNSAAGEWNISMDIDDRFMIFESSGRNEGKSFYGDLYVSYRKDDRWSNPENLGRLNTAGSELNPRFTPDGKFLFFASSNSLTGSHTEIKICSVDDLLN